MAKFHELLLKVTDEDLKKELQAEFTAVNTDAGERGRKLIEKDNEISTLRKKVEDSGTYSEAFKLLEKKGIAVKDIPALLEKLGKVKTVEDDLLILTEANKAKDSELNELRSFKKRSEVRDAIGKVLADEKSKFVNDKNEKLVVLDRFVDENKLYADIDVSNEVLLRERVKTVLKDGLQAQEAVRKEFGFQGAPIPAIPVAQGGSPGQLVGVVAQLKEITEKQGVAAGFDALLKLKEGNG